MTKEQKGKILKALSEDRNNFARDCNRRIAEEHGKITGADYMLQRFLDILRTHESMTAEEYRQRMMQAFRNADCDELIAVCVLPTEKEFEHLEWLLKNHYKKEPCEDEERQNFEVMKFPETFNEFVEQYGFTDKEEYYTNGSQLIPVFRVKQWLEHKALEQEPCVFHDKEDAE